MSATPPADMEPIFSSSQILGITGDRPQKEFTFVAASGEINERVIGLSNHTLVAWEISLPDDHDKVDIHRFAEDFQHYFNVHSLDIQVTKFHPEDFLTMIKTLKEDLTVVERLVENPFGHGLANRMNRERFLKIGLQWVARGFTSNNLHLEWVRLLKPSHLGRIRKSGTHTEVYSMLSRLNNFM
ncbi:hypothetical protein GUJ93_ZPchr0001g32728 [Zizania palustris]|uniref:Uncharacterized protein n=1 Tax=Zizania palustris TaxID=103762 RepID=A0A8J5RSR6_ZIZPA|nr:hypothetical protein GUJ93_ZPchr0001g32728 [Zizania palustris]